jgi:hypothetical protein
MIADNHWENLVKQRPLEVKELFRVQDAKH